MAISATQKTNGSGTGGSAFTTASISYSGGLILVAVTSSSFGSAPGTASVSGLSLTWVEVGHIDFSTVASPTMRLTLFRSMGSSATGTLSITPSNNNGTCWSIVEFSGTDTSGTNGSGAIVQSATNNTDGGSPNSLTVTLSALADATDNAVYAAFAVAQQTLQTPGTGYTELSDDNSLSPSNACSLETLWKVPGTTTPSASGQPDFADIGGIAVEIKAAAAGGTNYTRTLNDAVTVTDTPNRSASDFRRILEPAATVVDRLMQGIARISITHDNATVTDAMLRSVQNFRLLHDNADVSDAAWRSVLMFRRLLDTATVSDAVISTITLGSTVIISRTLHDNLDVQDLCSRAIQYYRLTHENSDVSDNVVRSASLARFATETLVVADAMARGLVLNRITTDTTTAVDNAVRYTLLARLLSDNVTVTDNLVEVINYYQQFVGFVLMLLESTEFVLMRLDKAQPIEMTTENLEFIVLEVTDR